MKTVLVEVPDAYVIGFDPTSPDAPSVGDGLPWVKHTVYHAIELCGDDHLAGLLLFHFIFLCRRAMLLIDGKRYYVRSRTDLCTQTRLTRHQYDRALKELKDLKFVEARRVPMNKVHVFGNSTAFRVTAFAIEKLKIIVEKQDRTI